MGLGDILDRPNFTFLMKDPNITSICAGFSQSFITKSNGEVFGFGYNIDKRQNNLFSHLNFFFFYFLLNIFYFFQRLGIDNNKNQSSPAFLFNKPLSYLFNNTYTFDFWTLESHFKFGENFKKCVFVFVLCLRKLYSKTKIKFTKYIIWMILSNLEFSSFEKI